MFSVVDEDSGQSMSCSLTSNSNGVFDVKNSQLILKKSLNFEQQKTHNIVVEVTDNGTPPLSVSFAFAL